MLNKKMLACAVGITIFSGNASAGGIDLTGMPITQLFEVGTFVEGSFTRASLDFSGTDVTGQDTGQLKDDFNFWGLTYKQDVNEKLSFAIIKDTPFFAETTYDNGLFTGLSNYVKSDSISGYLRYKFNENVAMHGGVGVYKQNAETDLPAVLTGGGDYSLDAKGKPSLGYAVGATYEIPKYHALVGLTYFSEVKNKLNATENGIDTGEFSLTTPESFNLDFRFPVSKKDLVFGDVRFGRWKGYSVTTPLGVNVVPELTENSIKYNLGVAHKFSDQWGGFARGGYESAPSEQDPNNFTGNRKTLAVGASFTKNKTRITGVLTRVVAEERTGSVGSFDDQDATGITLTVRQNF